MILSDRDIKQALEDGDLKISPYPDDVQFQPCSVDLRLGEDFKIQTGESFDEISGGIPIFPGESVLATTHEWVEIPDRMVAFVHGKSTVGRSFILVHTAGLVDPGFEGEITLEIVNLGKRSFFLEPGMRICQMTFELLTSECQRPYDTEGLKSKYQGQRGATEGLWR